MKKLLIFATLTIAGWPARAWAVTARVTGVPGPVRAARAYVDAAAHVLEAFDLPRSLAYPQREPLAIVVRIES